MTIAASVREAPLFAFGFFKDKRKMTAKRPRIGSGKEDKNNAT